ncbi:MAG: glycosyltransferase family 4 protein [Symploca sp. SIO2G7]|nr:glycosyltransferase family 4 protein [Symploca sp. SIO2G7]
MKIAHLTSVHPRYDTRILLKECRALATLGNYQVNLIVADGKGDQHSECVRIFDVNVTKRRINRIIATPWRIWQKARLVDTHIYHFHDPELIFIGLLLRASGKKVIYDVHEDLPRQTLGKYYIPQRLRKITALGLELIENFAAKYFDTIVTATPHIRDRFLKLDCNAIDVNNYPILSELHTPNLNWQQKEKAVCYVGGITEIRGIFTMIEAMSQVEGKLFLGGDFSSFQEKEQAIKTQGWSNINELGYLNREEVAQTLEKSMAGLVVLHPLINYLDALPVKMFEYMSASLPIIASNFPLWRQIIEKNNCGICVDPLNPQEIAQAIQWIFDHPQEAEQIGKNGRKAVEEKYNWETESKKLLALYQELLA